MRILIHPLGRSAAALILLTLVVAGPLALRVPQAAAAQSQETTLYFGPLPTTGDDVLRLSYFNSSEELSVPFEMEIALASTGATLASMSGVAAPLTGTKLEFPGSGLALPPAVAEDCIGKVRVTEPKPATVEIPNLKITTSDTGNAVATFSARDAGTARVQVTCDHPSRKITVMVKN